MAIDPKTQKFIVIAIAGQSNSVGYDESVWTKENENTHPDLIAQLGYHTVDGVDQNLKVIPLGVCAHNLQNMSNLPDSYSKPQSLGREAKGTKGLHLPLAKELYPYLPEGYGILIVPVAFGGTQLGAGAALTYDEVAKRPKPVGNSGMPSGGTWQITGSYYRTLKERVAYALDLNPENKFAGVIWCQGEFDAYKEADVVKNIEEFPKLVDTFCNDLKDKYANRLAEGKQWDRSLWLTHETCSYWKTNAAVKNQVARIWEGYKNVLGEANYVAMPVDDNDTNAVNGALNNKTWTSSLRNSHFGNDAFQRVVAPAVAKTIIRNKMIYGQKDAPVDTGKYTKYLKSFNAAENSFEVNNDTGLVKYVKTKDYGKNKLGPMTSIVFDPKVNSIELSNIVGGTIFILEYTDSGDYSGIIFNASNKPNTASNFTTTRGIGAKNLNTTGGAGVLSWDGFQYPNNLTVSAYDFAKGKVQVTRTPEGKYVFTKGDNKEAWFEYDIKNNASSLVKNGVAADQIKYGFGLGYGWASAFANGTTVANILATTEEQTATEEKPVEKPTEPEKENKKVKVVKFNANGGEGTMADVEVDLSNGNKDFTVPASTFTAPAGKQFKTWSEAADNETKVHAVNDVINFGNPGEFTLYAIYEDAPVAAKKVKLVKFFPGEGSGSMADVEVDLSKGDVTYTLPESTFTLPANKVFKNWLGSDNREFEVGGTVVFANEGEYTLTAQYQDAPQQPDARVKVVKFNANGGTGEMADVSVNLPATGTVKYVVPASTFTAPDGKQFKAWNTVADSTGTVYDVNEEVEFGLPGEITLYAIYEDAAVTPPAPEPTEKKVKVVKFNANGGQGTMADVEVDLSNGNANFTVPEFGFTAPEGKEFKTWSEAIDNEDKVHAPGSTVNFGLPGEFVLYAIYQDKAVVTPPTPDANGNSITVDPAQIDLTATGKAELSITTTGKKAQELSLVARGGEDKITVTFRDFNEFTAKADVAVKEGVTEGFNTPFTIQSGGGSVISNVITAVKTVAAEKPARPELKDPALKLEVEGGKEIAIELQPVAEGLVIGVQYPEGKGSVAIEGNVIKYTAPVVTAEESVTLSILTDNQGTQSDPLEIAVLVKVPVTQPEQPEQPTKPVKVVKFLPGEGSGSMADVEVDLSNGNQKFPIPESTFTAPEGKVFKVWLGSDNKEYAVGSEIDFGNPGEFTFTAQFEVDPNSQLPEANTIKVEPGVVDLLTTPEATLNITTTGKDAQAFTLKFVGGEEFINVTFKDFNGRSAVAVVTAKEGAAEEFETKFTVQSGGGSVVSNEITVTKKKQAEVIPPKPDANGNSITVQAVEVNLTNVNEQDVKIDTTGITAKAMNLKVVTDEATAKNVTFTFKDVVDYTAVLNVKLNEGYADPLNAVFTVQTGGGSVKSNEVYLKREAANTTPDNAKVVSFDAAGGTGTMADVTVPLGQWVIPDSQFIAPQGKYFLNWIDLATGITYLPGQTITFGIAGTIRFTAVYKVGQPDLKPDDTHKLVHFDSNYTTYAGPNEEVTNVINSLLVELGKYVLPENQFEAPKNRQFKGWAETADGKQNLRVPGDEVIFGKTGEFTFYAIWEELPPVSLEEYDAAVNDPNTSLQEKIEFILARGPIEERTLASKLEDYRQLTTPAIAGVLSEKIGVGYNYDLFNTIMEVLNEKDSEKFERLFDIVNYFFVVYNKQGDAYHWSLIQRFDRLWTFGEKSKLSYQNLMTLITELADISTRPVNVTGIDFNKLLDADQTVFTEVARNNIINYYS